MADKKSDNCIKCSENKKKTSGYKRTVISNDQASEIGKYLNKSVYVGDYICSKCYPSICKAVSKQKKNEESSQSTSRSSGESVVEYKESSKPFIERVELPFKRSVSTHKYCFLCGSRSKIISVPFDARKDVFIKRRIYIPNGNRCCSSHLIKKRFYADEIAKIRVASHSSMVELPEISKLLDSLSLGVDRELMHRVGDFTFPEERLKVLTGLNWENIIRLREMMSSMRNSETRSVNQALVAFLFKLRSGNSNNLISAVLGLERPQQVTEFSSSVLKSFANDVLPTRFGIKAVSRDELIENNTAPIAKKIHNIQDDQLALICDGTYLRHEKSSNNEYQRKSYSGQKKVPLCKPFTVCTTNGYIVDILGPFYANQNDANILELILSDPDGLSTILKEGDVFVLDRGFRDVVKHLEQLKYKVLMPALKGQRKQLTTEEANHSRRVTMARWPVEAVHGVIGQKFKLLHSQFDNKLLPVAALYCRIAGFLQNEFGKRFVSNIANIDEVISEINKKDSENSLALEVTERKWSRRKIPFQKLTSADVLDFPEMTEDDLKTLFTGTYQLQLAISYLAEMMGDSSEINMQYLKETHEIVKFQVRSRHISSKTYNCYIHYKPDTIGYSGILRYYCECANGMRTIGCCAHVATVIYYLSHARYLSKIIRPAEKLAKIFETEQVVPVINEESDEDN